MLRGWLLTPVSAQHGPSAQHGMARRPVGRHDGRVVARRAWCEGGGKEGWEACAQLAMLCFSPLVPRLLSASASEVCDIMKLSAAGRMDMWEGRRGRSTIAKRSEGGCRNLIGRRLYGPRCGSGDAVAALSDRESFRNNHVGRGGRVGKLQGPRCQKTGYASGL